MDERVLLGRSYEPYQFFKYRQEVLEAELKKNGGRLQRHMLWRLDYYRYPYLLLETDEKIAERFSDLLVNCVDLSRDCKIVPSPGMKNGGRLLRYFTEVVEETSWRGVLTKEVVRNATNPVAAYFKEGIPVGCRMFGDRDHPAGEWLVKYSKRSFVDDMLKFGRFRISPASEYSKGSYLKAIKDLETARPYSIKALSDYLTRGDTIVINNVEMKIKNGFLAMDFVIDDYYLFSTSKEIDRRMPTDFDADAALIVKSKSVFLSRLRKAMKKKHPTWQFIEREAYYYDPYNDIPRDRDQEFWKHFSYSYQKEHRSVLRPLRKVSEELTPFFIEIGPLDDIAEAVYAPS